MTTPKQLAANIQNSNHSTGPKSDSGKVIASQNAIRHGMLSTRLVVPELESEQGWMTHHQEIKESFSPVGGIEHQLVERIAFNLWRLNRVARYEAEDIRICQESAVQVVSNRRASASITEELPLMSINPEEAVRWAESCNNTKILVQKFITAKEDDVFTNEEVDGLIDLAFIYVENVEEIPIEQWPPNQEAFKEWNAAMIRRIWEWLAKVGGLDAQKFVQTVLEDVDKDFYESKKYALEASRDLDLYRRRHLLPAPPTLELICRYESHLHRAFQRDLHELQRIQSARHGNYVQPPAVLDVDVTSGEVK